MNNDLQYRYITHQAEKYQQATLSEIEFNVALKELKFDNNKSSYIIELKHLVSYGSALI